MIFWGFCKILRVKPIFNLPHLVNQCKCTSNNSNILFTTFPQTFQTKFKMPNPGHSFYILKSCCRYDNVCLWLVEGSYYCCRCGAGYMSPEITHKLPKPSPCDCLVNFLIPIHYSQEQEKHDDWWNLQWFVDTMRIFSQSSDKRKSPVYLFHSICY